MKMMCGSLTPNPEQRAIFVVVHSEVPPRDSPRCVFLPSVPVKQGLWLSPLKARGTEARRWRRGLVQGHRARTQQGQGSNSSSRLRTSRLWKMPGTTTSSRCKSKPRELSFRKLRNANPPGRAIFLNKINMGRCVAPIGCTPVQSMVGCGWGKKGICQPQSPDGQFFLIIRVTHFPCKM